MSSIFFLCAEDSFYFLRTLYNAVSQMEMAYQGK